jgi:glycosyltransferase involved in cell wall biosynthesis
MTTVNTNDEIRVGVIIPCYNSAKTVTRAIDSVLEQTEKVDEIIIVDDGSTDDTANVIKEYSDKVIYIYQENCGVSKARNNGIEASTCNWIGFLDADDSWYKTKNEKQKKIIRKYHVSWCAGQVTTNSSIDKVDCSESPKEKELELNFFEAFANGVSFQTGAFLIKKELLKKMNLFDEYLKISEDRDLWWKIGLSESNIGYVNEPVVHYNEFEEFSLMKQSKDRNDSVKVLIRLLKAFKGNEEAVSESVLGYFTWMGFNYILRQKIKEISVDQNMIDELYDLMRLSNIQKFLVMIFNFDLPFEMRKRLLYLVRRFSWYERVVT